MSRARTLLASLALLALTLAAYAPALRAGFIWDDDYYVYENANLQNLAGLWRIWTQRGAVPQYYPLVHTTYWLEYQLWGLHPMGYHLVQVLLHGGVAALLWRVLRRLNVPGAWFAAALFALHPVHVESVAWVTERKNTLSGLFYMLAMLSYLRWRPLEETQPPWPPQAQPWSRLRWYALAWCCFVAALLSKTVTSTFSPVLLVLLWWKQGTIRWRDVAWLLPFFAVGALLGLNTAWMEKHIVGATGPEFAWTPLERVLIAGRALWFYAGKLAWPQTLTFFYPRWEIDTGSWWQWVFPLTAAGLMIALALLSRRLGRGTAAGVFIFAGTLFPALGFVNVFPMRYSYVADHFQYLASIGLLTLAAAGATLLASKGSAIARQGALVAGAVVLAALGVRTWAQCYIYHDKETLYRAVLRDNPQGWMAWNNLAVLLHEQGRYDESLHAATRALELRPADAQYHFNLGNTLAAMGRRDAALAAYRAALQLKPDHGDAHFNLANTLAERDEDLPLAITHYQQAIALRPANPTMRQNLGAALHRLKRYDEAIAAYRSALALNPKIAEVHHNLGFSLESASRLDEAAASYRQALAIDPGYISARQKLGLLLARQGRWAEAVQELTLAVQHDPQQPSLQHNLGSALLQVGRSRDAAEHLRQAVALRPQHVPSLRTLAWLLATDRDDTVRAGNEAVTLAERALQVGGDDPVLLDVAAAACAEAGRWDEAIAYARRSIDAAQAAGRSDFAQQVRQRLAQYESRRPYRP